MPELTTFASRKPAAYIAGTVLPDGITTSKAMLDHIGGSGWDVRLREIVTDARTTKTDFEVIRTNPYDGGIDRLGISGERYGVVQNEQAFGMFDDLAPKWDAGGVFKGGRMVYGSAKSDRTIVIDPKGAADVVKPFLHVITTHDGSGALRLNRTAMRMDCFNQFGLIFGKSSGAMALRHTLTISDRMKKIRLFWKGENAALDALEAEANALFEKSCTDKQFFGIVGHLMGDRPEENKKGAQTKYDNSLELFSQAWRGATNANVHGTMWGAFQALIERNQWGRTIQNTPNGVENFAMAGMGLDQNTEAFRRNALALVRAA
jgi:hypothetical protein